MAGSLPCAQMSYCCPSPSAGPSAARIPLTKTLKAGFYYCCDQKLRGRLEKFWSRRGKLHEYV